MPRDGSPRTRDDCTRRVLRSGPWNHGPDQIRAAYRVPSGTESRSHGNGLRVARSLD
jgi:formylglycine-generating enzyme required for sulfatase activity